MISVGHILLEEKTKKKDNNKLTLGDKARVVGTLGLGAAAIGGK